MRPQSLQIPVLALLAIGFVVAYCILPPAAPLMVPDSYGYLDFSVDRPIGYPAFLQLVKVLTGSHEFVPFAQRILFGMCAFTLATTVLSRTRSFATAAVVELGILGHPGPMRLADTIISDALSASLMLLYAAALWWYYHRPTASRLTLLSLFMFLAMIVKPINIALVPVTLVAILLVRSRAQTRWWMPYLVPGTFVLLGLIVTPLSLWWIHGSAATTSPLARAVVQKALFGDFEARKDPAICHAGQIESVLAPVNDYLRGVPAEFQDILKYRYSQIIRFQVVIPGLRAEQPRLSEDQINATLMCFTLSRLKERPFLLVSQTLHEYWKTVSNYTFISEREQAAYDAFVERHRPVIPAWPAGSAQAPREASPEELQKYFHSPAARPGAVILALNGVQILAAVLSLTLAALVLVKAVGGRTSAVNPWPVMGLMGLCANALLLLTAAVELAEARYLFPVWPLLWTPLALAGLWAVHRLIRLRSSGAPPG